MRHAVPLLVLVLVVFSLRSASAAEGTRIGEYVFSLDGKPFRPEIVHLEGEPGRPAPGDVFRLNPYWIVLGEEKEVHLRKVEEEEDWDSYRLEVGGKSRWVAVAVRRFRSLSREEIRGLWAIHISREAKLPDQVEELRLERASISVDVDMPPPGGTAPLPELPSRTRYLPSRSMPGLTGSISEAWPGSPTSASWTWMGFARAGWTSASSRRRPGSGS